MTGDVDRGQYEPAPAALSFADAQGLLREREFRARLGDTPAVYKPGPITTGTDPTDEPGRVTYHDSAGIVITLTGEIPSSALRRAADFLQNLS